MTAHKDKAKGIIFVKERCKNTEVERSTEYENSTEVSQEKLSGAEAKRFYENVISMPQESPAEHTERMVTARRKRKRPKVKRKTQANKVLRTDQPSAAHVSVDQVFRSVQEGDLEQVRTAISGGVCDVNTTDHFHWTLLMSAAHAGHMHIVDYLLRMGANWRDCVDRSGCNAVDLAKMAGHLSLACYIETHKDGVTERDEDSETGSQGGGYKASRHSKATTTYYCDVCKQNVTEYPTEKHATSTVHQFSCQHRPPVHCYAIPRSNRGYQMMLRSGWNPEKGLGFEQEGKKFPVKTILKQDRLGFGQPVEESSQRKARVTHFAAFDERAVKRHAEKFEKRGPALRKKDIVTAARKDKKWEVQMRRYMNSDEYFSQHS